MRVVMGRRGGISAGTGYGTVATGDDITVGQTHYETPAGAGGVMGRVRGMRRGRVGNGRTATSGGLFRCRAESRLDQGPTSQGGNRK